MVSYYTVSIEGANIFRQGACTGIQDKRINLLVAHIRCVLQSISDLWGKPLTAPSKLAKYLPDCTESLAEIANSEWYSLRMISTQFRTYF